jgi:uncharacterized membrane protein YoaK (UPF0700 family)
MEVPRWKISNSAPVYALAILLAGAALLGVTLFMFPLQLFWVVAALGIVALLRRLSGKTRLPKVLLTMLLIAVAAFFLLHLTKENRTCDPATISTAVGMASCAR